MLPRAIKFAYVVIVMASAMLAFITLRGQDERATAGSSSVLRIDKPDDGASAFTVADSSHIAATRSALQRFARDLQFEIGRAHV